LILAFEGQASFEEDGRQISIEQEKALEVKPLPIEEASTDDFPFQLLQKPAEQYKVAFDEDNHLTVLHLCDLQDNRLFSIDYRKHFPNKGLLAIPAPDYSYILIVGREKEDEDEAAQSPNVVGRLYENPIVQLENGNIYQRSFEEHKRETFIGSLRM